MKTRFLRDLKGSATGYGCMGFSHGYGAVPELHHFWFPSGSRTYIAGQQYESLIAIKATIPSFGGGFEGPKSL